MQWAYLWLQMYNDDTHASGVMPAALQHAPFWQHRAKEVWLDDYDVVAKIYECSSLSVNLSTAWCGVRGDQWLASETLQ